MLFLNFNLLAYFRNHFESQHGKLPNYSFENYILNTQSKVA